MNSYNLTNLDIAAKAGLEEILRPTAFKIIEPWLAQATQKQKKQILFVQGISRMVFTDIKATGPNAYGKAAVLAETKASVDAGQNQFHIRRTNSEHINQPQRQARDHFRDYEAVQTNNAVQRYFICEQDGPAAQPFSKVLKPKSVQQLDQWQVFGSATPQLKADVCAVLRTVEMQHSSMPTYFGMLNETPKMDRGPFLFEFSKRHQTYATRRGRPPAQALGAPSHVVGADAPREGVLQGRGADRPSGRRHPRADGRASDSVPEGDQGCVAVQDQLCWREHGDGLHVPAPLPAAA